MGVRSEHRLRLLRVDHRRDLRRLVAWMKASTGTSRIDARGNNRRVQALDFLARQFESWGFTKLVAFGVRTSQSVTNALTARRWPSSSQLRGTHQNGFSSRPTLASWHPCSVS